jgi:hypothetical protein
MKKRVLFFIMLLGIFNTIAKGQDSIKTTPKNLFWGSVGFGVYAGGGSGNYLHNKDLFTVRYYGNIAGQGDLSYEDKSVLYGRIFSNKNRDILLSASIGLGIINITEGVFLGPMLKVKQNLLNVPIEAQIIFIPFKYMGIGLKAFANINSYNVSGWGLLTLQFGKLK